MIPKHNNKYLETSIQTASPAQLLLMLYDGAIRFSRSAIEAIQQKKYAEANDQLIKVQNIIKEFMVTLDQNAPISKSLMPLYEYFIHRLMEANLTKKAEPVEEVLGYLVELRETWAQAARQVNPQSNGLKVNHA